MRANTRGGAKYLRIILGDEWSAAELSEFLRNVDQVCNHVLIFEQLLKWHKDYENFKIWMDKAPVYSTAFGEALPEPTKTDLAELRRRFGYEALRIFRVQIGSPGLIDLRGVGEVAKVLEKVGAGVRWILWGWWLERDKRKTEKALEDLQIKEREIDVESRKERTALEIERETVKLQAEKKRLISQELKNLEQYQRFLEAERVRLKKLGYTDEQVQAEISRYDGQFKKFKPYAETGKIIEVKVTSSPPKALPVARHNKRPRKRRPNRGARAGGGAREKRSQTKGGRRLGS